MREAIFLPFRQYSFTICSGIIAPFFASVDKGTRGFSRGKTPSGCVILVGGRQPTCLVCLASHRLSSAKNSEGLAGTAGALPARQRTQACWRKSRTITPQAAFQPRPQARVPLSADAYITIRHGADHDRFRNDHVRICGDLLCSGGREHRERHAHVQPHALHGLVDAGSLKGRKKRRV